MPKSQGEFYKETLKQEVDKIPEQDASFMIKVITIIRKHIEKAGKQ